MVNLSVFLVALFWSFNSSAIIMLPVGAANAAAVSSVGSTANLCVSWGNCDATSYVIAAQTTQDLIVISVAAAFFISAFVFAYNANTLTRSRGSE